VNFISLLLILFLIGCARPQYLSPDTSTPPALKPQTENGCVARFKHSGGCLDIKWELLPTEEAFGSFVFTTSDISTGLLKDFTKADLKVILWMPSMGHGSSPVSVEKLSTGIYRAKNVFFNMKADWEIRFQIGTDEAVFAIFI
jgi:hypothetical protein